MNRIYKIQEKMLLKIAEFENSEAVRDMSLNWERIHMISCAKIGQILALKRGADVELAAIACSVHDFGRIITGKQKNHAEICYEPLKVFLAECGCFSAEEIEILARAGKKHSSKSEVGTPLEEIVKDADVLDCFQYGVPLEREEQKRRLEKIIIEIIG
ncbi:MAG: HD domain-containing protein [Dehalobacterium sp.]